MQKERIGEYFFVIEITQKTDKPVPVQQSFLSKSRENNEKLFCQFFFKFQESKEKNSMAPRVLVK